MDRAAALGAMPAQNVRHGGRWRGCRSRWTPSWAAPAWSSSLTRACPTYMPASAVRPRALIAHCGRSLGVAAPLLQPGGTHEAAQGPCSHQVCSACARRSPRAVFVRGALGRQQTAQVIRCMPRPELARLAMSRRSV
jgi:hypothetical protein